MRERQGLRQLRRVVMVAAGAGLIVWILWAVGWPAIHANLSVIGWWFFPLAAFFLFSELAFMAGWWVLIDPQVRQSHFVRLFGVCLAGHAVNYFIPAGNVAGDPVRVDLSRDTLGLSQAIASVTVHRSADLLAQWIFLATGIVVSLSQFDLSTPIKLAAAFLLAGFGVGIFLMAWALRRGTFLPIVQRLINWRRLSARLKSYLPLAEALDAKIQPFYSRKKGGVLAASTAWCLVQWCGGLLETYIILRLLAPTAGWATAVAIEALAMVLNSLLVFVPGRVGTAEGVRVGVFVLLGLPAAQGVAYGLVRRGRELLWVVVGLVVLVRRYAGRLGRLDLSDSPREKSLV